MLRGSSLSRVDLLTIVLGWSMVFFLILQVALSGNARYDFNKADLLLISVLGLVFALVEWARVKLPSGFFLLLSPSMLVVSLWLYGPLVALGILFWGMAVKSIPAKTEPLDVMYQTTLYIFPLFFAQASAILMIQYFQGYLSFTLLYQTFSLAIVDVAPLTVRQLRLALMGLAPIPASFLFLTLAISFAVFCFTNFLGFGRKRFPGENTSQSMFIELLTVRLPSYGVNLFLAFVVFLLHSVGVLLAWLVYLGIVGSITLFLRGFVSRNEKQALERLIGMLDQAEYSSDSYWLLELSQAIGNRLRLSWSELVYLRFAALLHDIRLSPDVVGLRVYKREEAERIMLHPQQAACEISKLASLKPVAEIVKYHHERWDGYGYPEGLKGEEIPLGARIMGVVDYYIVLRSPSLENKVMSEVEAVAAVEKEKGKAFDPRVVDAFLDIMQEWLDPMVAVTKESSFTVSQGSKPYDDMIQRLKSYVFASSAQEEVIREEMPVGRREERLVRKAEEILAVNNFGQLLNSSLSVKEVSEILVQSAGYITKRKTFVALTVSDEWSITATFGFKQFTGTWLGLKEKDLKRLETGKSVVVPRSSLSTYLSFVELHELNEAGELMLIPVIYQESLLGILGLITRAGQLSPGEMEQKFLEAILRQAAVALRRIQRLTIAEQRLEESIGMHRFLAMILETMTDPIIAIDREENILLLNRAARDLMKKVVSEDEVYTGRNIEELSVLAGITRYIKAALEKEKQTHLSELVIRGPRGSRLVEVTIKPLQDDTKNAKGVLIVGNDRTEEKRLQEEIKRAERLADIGQMAAGAAHEIKNPLTSIKGFVQMMQYRINDKDQTWSSEDVARKQQQSLKYLDIIQKEIERIDSIVQDLLLMTRHSSMQKVPCNLQNTIKEIALSLEPLSEEKSVQWQMDFMKSSPIIDADPRQLKQVFVNLFKNGIEAMATGGTLNISTGIYDENHALIVVADEGKGISESELARIFDPFYTTKDEGTGLGLPVTYGIIHRHGGQLKVESKVGEGTKFLLIWPLAKGVRVFNQE